MEKYRAKLLHFISWQCTAGHKTRCRSHFRLVLDTVNTRLACDPVWYVRMMWQTRFFLPNTKVWYIFLKSSFFANRICKCCNCFLIRHKVNVLAIFKEQNRANGQASQYAAVGQPPPSYQESRVQYRAIPDLKVPQKTAKNRTRIYIAGCAGAP